MKDEIREILQGTEYSGRRLTVDEYTEALDVGVPELVIKAMEKGEYPAVVELSTSRTVRKGERIRINRDLWLTVKGEPKRDKGKVTIRVNVTDVRPEALLRNSPPAHRPGRRMKRDRETGQLVKRPDVKPTTKADEIAAGIESAYTDEPGLSMKAEREHPPHYWQDAGTASRKVRQIDDRKELQSEASTREKLRIIKAQLNEVSLRMVNLGQDPQPMLDEIAAQVSRARDEMDTQLDDAA